MEELIQRFENIKAKWFKIDEKDILDLEDLRFEFADYKIEMDSNIYEVDLNYNQEYSDRYAEIYSELDDKWKRKHTVDTAKNEVNKEFQERDLDNNKKKEIKKKLQNHIDRINWYIVILRQYLNKWV